MCSRNFKYMIKDFLHATSYKGWLPVLCGRSEALSKGLCNKEPVLNQARFMTDKAFNLADIVKANAKHKPGKSIGATSKKQLNKTATTKTKKVDADIDKTAESSSGKTNTVKLKTLSSEKSDEEAGVKKEASNRKKVTESTSRTKKEKVTKENSETIENAGEEVEESENVVNLIPAYLKLVLEAPLILDKELDTEISAQFKEFVEDLELKYLPSVTTIISATQPPEQVKVLMRWKNKMIKELGGVDQFNEYQKGLLSNGQNLHKCIENQLSGKPDETPLREGNKGHWESITKVLPEISDVVFMEKECVHPELYYRGKFDCIAKYRGTLCLIEWKTSAKPKPLLSNTYDNPLQIAAYLGAINRSHMLMKEGYDQVTNGAIVIAYTDGEPATVHSMNLKQCERYWRLWVKRLYQYWVDCYDKKLATESTS